MKKKVVRLMGMLTILTVFTILHPQMLPAEEGYTCRISASTSASDNIAVSTMEGDKFTVTTFYINPLHSSNLGAVSYITLVILDNRTGKVTVTKIPEKDFGGGKAYMFLPHYAPSKR